MQPGRRVVWHPALPPLLDRSHERVLCELLGSVEVTDEPGQPGQHPGRFDAPQGRNGGVDVRCIHGGGRVAETCPLSYWRSSASTTRRTSTRSEPTRRANLRACSTASASESTSSIAKPPISSLASAK